MAKLEQFEKKKKKSTKLNPSYKNKWVHTYINDWKKEKGKEKKG